MWVYNNKSWAVSRLWMSPEGKKIGKVASVWLVLVEKSQIQLRTKSTKKTDRQKQGERERKYNHWKRVNVTRNSGSGIKKVRMTVDMTREERDKNTLGISEENDNIRERINRKGWEEKERVKVRVRVKREYGG